MFDRSTAALLRRAFGPLVRRGYLSVRLPDGQTLVATDLTSDACGSERIAGVTPLIRLGNARTFYRCNY